MTNVGYLCTGCYFLITLICFGCAGFVYRANSKRTADDPKKRDYHPLALWLIPIWPLLALGWVTLAILGSVLYAVFMFIFTFILITAREPFIIKWMKKIGYKVGDKLLSVNTSIIRLILLPFGQRPAQSSS